MLMTVILIEIGIPCANWLSKLSEKTYKVPKENIRTRPSLRLYATVEDGGVSTLLLWEGVGVFAPRKPTLQFQYMRDGKRHNHQVSHYIQSSSGYIDNIPLTAGPLY